MVLIEVKMVFAHWLMFSSRPQFLVLMYLVTYLGRLCNGLTVLIIGKKAKTPTRCLSCQKLNIVSSSRCDRCVFSATFLQTASGKSPGLQLFTLWIPMVSAQTSSPLHSQEQVDGFFAKIQANIDNIKDM